jgi:2-C-methyl-D-erythritol 2,4-cyclodiphosphate synthase
MAKSIRVGIGKYRYNISGNITITLGGIEIPNSESENNDPSIDCLIYAVSDALLGAAALGGIAQIPDFYEKVESKAVEVVKDVERKVHYEGYAIVNIDSTILTSNNVINKYLNRIHENLTSLLFIKPEQLNVKVCPYPDSDSETLKEKIECNAVVSLKKR